MPVIGVSKAGWNLDQFKARALDSLEKHGGVDPEAFRKLSSLLRYVDGDYGDPATFEVLGRELQGSRRPAHYLAIPPAMFEPVLENLTHCHCMANARMIVEKPFGHDLASARHLNKVLLQNESIGTALRRIHRIGQTEVCHLWNLLADETREGDVYRRLLEKIEQERQALGGGVFDILGQLFREQRLRDLLIEAIRYGDRPEVKVRLHRIVDNLTARQHCQELLEERALAEDCMDASQVQKIREEMERAEARRLQPHFIESFFLEAFRILGGSLKEREPRRYEMAVENLVSEALERGTSSWSRGIIAWAEEEKKMGTLIEKAWMKLAPFGVGMPDIHRLVDMTIRDAWKTDQEK